MTDRSSYVYESLEDCQRAQAEENQRERERQEYADVHSSSAKLDRIIRDLKECMNIHPGTIATCSFQSLQIKAMVRVCQAFASENKEYLNYY